MAWDGGKCKDFLCTDFLRRPAGVRPGSVGGADRTVRGDGHRRLRDQLQLPARHARAQDGDGHGAGLRSAGGAPTLHTDATHDRHSADV